MAVTGASALAPPTLIRAPSDPKGEHAIHAAQLITNVDYTPYEGFPLNGCIRQVWLRGRRVVDEGKLLEERGGQYLRRGLPRL